MKRWISLLVTFICLLSAPAFADTTYRAGANISIGQILTFQSDGDVEPADATSDEVVGVALQTVVNGQNIAVATDDVQCNCESTVVALEYLSPSAVAGEAAGSANPTTTTFALARTATASGKCNITFMRRDAAGGSGITGPGSSTDNAVIRWDGTGGTSGQDSGVIIDDSDNMTGVTMNANVLTAGVVTHERGGLEVDASAFAGVPLITGGVGSEIKYNLTATRPPDPTDDTSPGGYVIGSLWADRTDDTLWEAVDITDGAAVWKKISEDVVLPTILGRFWFVATNGNDGNGGTAAAPKLTIQAAVDLARAGDAVIIRGGLYQITREIDVDQADGFEGAPILIIGYPGETATIDCQGDGAFGATTMDAAFYVDGRDWITFKDLTFIDLDGGDAGAPRGLNGHGFVLTISAEHVTLDNITGSNVVGPVGENKGAVFFGIGSHYPVVKNCHFTNVWITGDHNHASIFSDESNYGIYTNNIIDGNQWVGIFIKWSSTATDNGQIIEGNTISGLQTAGGIGARGIWVTGDASDANIWGRIRFNLIVTTSGASTGIAMSENTSDTFNWEVAYNTIIGGGRMLHEQENNNGNRVADNWYHHNIFYTTDSLGDVAFMEFHSYSDGTNADDENWLFENNVVWANSATPLFGVGNGAGGNTTDTTVAAFESGFAFSADSSWKGGTGARNNSDSDPVLISADGYIFSGVTDKGYNVARDDLLTIYTTKNVAHGEIPMWSTEEGGSVGRWVNKTLTEAGFMEGPVSATDNTIPRYDGTTGSLLQGSSVVINDSDVMSGFTAASDTILLDSTGSPAFTTLQHVQDTFHSAGWFSGGVIIDTGGTNVVVTTGEGAIRTTASATGNLRFFTWSGLGSTAIPADTTRYIGVEWNAGSPQVVVRTSDTFAGLVDFILGVAVNEGGTLHITNAPFGVGDHPANMVLRLHEVNGVQRDNVTGGLALAETGTRNLTVSAGSLWDRLTTFAISAIDTSAAGDFDAYSRDGSGGFTKVTAATQWDNQNYDNDPLTALTNNRWGVLWFYLELDGDMVMLYGREQHTSQAAAETQEQPGTFPGRFDGGTILIARLIFQKSAGTGTIETAFGATFTPGAEGGPHPIDLTTDVTGVLPPANGGLGTDPEAFVDGLVGVASSAVIDVDTLAELNTAISSTLVDNAMVFVENTGNDLPLFFSASARVSSTPSTMNIATLPGGSVLTVDTISETNWLTAVANGNMGQWYIRNVTDGDAPVRIVTGGWVSGTSTFTLADSVPAGWGIGEQLSLATGTTLNSNIVTAQSFAISMTDTVNSGATLALFKMGVNDNGTITNGIQVGSINPATGSGWFGANAQVSGILVNAGPSLLTFDTTSESGQHILYFFVTASGAGTMNAAGNLLGSIDQ